MSDNTKMFTEDEKIIFDPGKMYSGMKPDKKYTLEELGIKY